MDEKLRKLEMWALRKQEADLRKTMHEDYQMSTDDIYSEASAFMEWEPLTIIPAGTTVTKEDGDENVQRKKKLAEQNKRRWRDKIWGRKNDTRKIS